MKETKPVTRSLVFKTCFLLLEFVRHCNDVLGYVRGENSFTNFAAPLIIMGWFNVVLPGSKTG